MQYRKFGRTGWDVSTVSFGAWAIGADWGSVDDQDSLTALHKAVDLGTTLFDTADVYGDGRSERLLAKLKKDRGADFHIITKAGRRLNPHIPAGYNRTNLTAFVERSLKNLETERLELVQLHCPPTEVYYIPETFGVLDDLVQAGKIQYYGVSVEKVEEALKAIEFSNVQSIQIIFNMFRQRPADLFFKLAQERQVGILARVPLSSGMLTGKFTKDSKFNATDHRRYNRHGEVFDVGETFSGVDYDLSLEAVERLIAVKPASMSMTQFALRWILMFEAVTCAIPGAKRVDQVSENAAASDMPDILPETMRAVKEIYESLIKDQVHHLW